MMVNNMNLHGEIKEINFNFTLYRPRQRQLLRMEKSLTFLLTTNLATRTCILKKKL